LAGHSDGAIMQNMIDAKEIHHLAQLARIKVTEEEVVTLQKDITKIVEYVGSITSLTTDTVDVKSAGVQYNVFRTDEVTNEPRQYTKVLLEEAPDTHQGYLVVKKILNTDDN